MSSSFGGGGQGDIKYVISIDDSQAVQKLQSVGQQFQTLGNATQQTQQQMGQMPQTLNEVATESDKVAQSTDKTTQAFEKQGQKARQAKTEQESFGQVMRNNVTNLIQIGTGILGLVSNYTSLQRAQLSINKLQVTEANQVRLLDVLTRKHAEAVAKYGANSQEALDIENKINILQAKHTNTVDQLNIRQEQLTQSQIGFGISLISTGAGIVQAATGLKTYKAGADAAKVATIGLTQSINRLKVATVIGAVLVAIEIAAQAVAHNFMGLRDWFDQVYNSLVKMAPAFKPVIDALFTIGEVATAIFTGDFDKIGKILGGQTAEGAVAAAGGLDDMGESAAEAGKELESLLQIFDEFQKVGTQLIVEASKGNRSEQRDFLKSLGIKGDEKEKVRDVLDAVEDATKEAEQAASKLEALEGFNILATLGFDIPDDAIEDIQNTLDSDLRDLISGDNDPFSKLAKLLDESDNKEEYGQILAEWATENPELLAALGKFNPRLAAAIESYVALLGINTQNKLDQVKLTFDPGVTFEANSKTLMGLHKDGDKGSGPTKKTLFDQLFEGFTPSNVKKRLGEIMGQISDAVTDPEFWHAIGATALGALFTVGNAINTYIMPWLAEIAKTVTDIKFWQAVAETNLGALFAVGTAFNKYIMPWLSEIAKTVGDINFWKALGETVLGLLIQGLSVLAPVTEFLANTGKTLTDPNFWFDVGKRIVGGIVKGMTQDSLISKALQGQFTIPMPESPKDTSNASNSKTLMSLHKNKNKTVWDSLSEIGKGITGFFSQQAFGADGNIFGDQGVFSKDVAGSLKPIFPGGGFAPLGKGGKSGTDFNNIPISLGDREDKGKEINKFDQISRQLVQIIKNMNTFAQTIVQVTKNINTWAKATVTQTKDNDQLARTIVQITKNNNTYAKTIVTVTKDLNQIAKATVQNTKNNNTFAKTIVETTKDFNQMARGVNQNTKNLNTFARAVNQTTSNVKKLTSALNDIPTNIKVGIRVGLSGAGAPFLDNLI